MAQQESLYRYSIDRFYGLNTSGADQSLLKPGESPYMKNFTVTDSYALRKRDGYKKLCEFGGNIRALLTADLEGECLFVVADNDILIARPPLYAQPKQVGSVGDSKNCFFVRFGGSVYLWGGGKIQVYDTSSGKFCDIQPYRPLVAISCDTKTGAGTPFEGVNLLTTQMRKQFSPKETGSNGYFVEKVPCKSIDYVMYRGEPVDPDKYRLPGQNRNCVLFDNDFELSYGEVNTIEIGYTMYESEENLTKITGCSHHMFYGGENDTKIFLWGNPDYPDARFWSETVNGLPSAVYFPENNFTRVGDGEKICDIVRQYDRQLIFCEKSAYVSYIEQKTDALGRNYFSFPVRTISDTKGSALCGQTKLVDNAPVTLTSNGLYRWVSTVQRDERNTVKISGRIEEALLKEDIESAKMFDCEKNGELFIYFPNGRVYVYRYGIDVFCLYEGIKAQFFFTDKNGKVCFCADGALYAFFEGLPSDDGSPIDCVWQSHYLDMGYPGRKNLYQTELIYRPQNGTGFDLRWVGDNDATGIFGKFLPSVSRRELDFDDMDFNDFAFCTARPVKRFKYRMRAKRFTKLKLIIQDNSASHSIYLRRIALSGRCTDI